MDIRLHIDAARPGTSSFKQHVTGAVSDDSGVISVAAVVDGDVATVIDNLNRTVVCCFEILQRLRASCVVGTEMSSCDADGHVVDGHVLARLFDVDAFRSLCTDSRNVGVDGLDVV